MKQILWMTLSAVACAAFVVSPARAERYNQLDDAVLSQVQTWQAGGKAKPIMSADGKLVFPFGQGMPKLVCSPTRACDIEMEPGETPRKVTLGDGQNWSWDGADSIESGKTVNHIIVQPKDNGVETNLIVTTDRRTYHIRLYAPKEEGAFVHRLGFYFPEALVSSWDARMGKAAEIKAQDEAINVMPAAVSPDKLAFDYRIDGKADFKPLRVFNNGEQVFISMPEDIRHGEYPTLSLIDEKGQYMVVDYRRTLDEKTGAIHFVVDKLFAKAELRRGDESVMISWKRKEKRSWPFGSN